MKKTLPKIIVICGPTATGKSDYAVGLAKKIDGEIISADSRQVYTGLDIGAGKISKKEMKGIPHYILDIISPKKIFSVSDFQKLAYEKIDDTLKRKKVPIVCGGTGFYINSIVNGTALPEVPPNEPLRRKLEKLSLDKLQRKLKELDPKRFKEIDIKNPVRLIRSIEIAKSLGRVPKTKQTPRYEAEIIYLDFPDLVLKKRIHDRLLRRLKQGIINEVENLHKNGLSWKRLHALGLEYRYISLLIQKKISRAEMIEQLETEIWHYAKRQRTWFKKYSQP